MDSLGPLSVASVAFQVEFVRTGLHVVLFELPHFVLHIRGRERESERECACVCQADVRGTGGWSAVALNPVHVCCCDLKKTLAVLLDNILCSALAS